MSEQQVYHITLNDLPYEAKGPNAFQAVANLVYEIVTDAGGPASVETLRVDEVLWKVHASPV